MSSQSSNAQRMVGIHAFVSLPELQRPSKKYSGSGGLLISSFFIPIFIPVLAFGAIFQKEEMAIAFFLKTRTKSPSVLNKKGQ